MVIPNMVKEQFEEWDSEQGLLVFFVLVSGYMVVRATEFGRTSALFPQYVGSATLIGSLLLLFREYLPEPLYSVVAGSTAIFDREDAEPTEQREQRREEREAEEPARSRAVDRPLHPSLFTGILITAYIAASYYFSMLLMTPLFVVAYLLWFRQPWYMIVLLTALASGLAYAFTTVLIVPVDEGVFVGDLLFLFRDWSVLVAAAPASGVV